MNTMNAWTEFVERAQRALGVVASHRLRRGGLQWALAALLAGCATGPENRPLAGERYALIQTQVGRSAQRIFPVEIYQIDGREVARGRSLHKIEPGVHTVRARSIVNRELSGGLGRGGSAGGDQLTHNFQSGQRYFIGLKAEAPRSADWELIIWKVEAVEAGTVSLDAAEPDTR